MHCHENNGAGTTYKFQIPFTPARGIVIAESQRTVLAPTSSLAPGAIPGGWTQTIRLARDFLVEPYDVMATMAVKSITPAEPATEPARGRCELNEVPSGSRIVVQHIEPAGQAMQRLMAMGLCVGRELEVVRQGNPLILRLLGARIGVSSRLARHVIVERRA
jgi:Fe2+ transport system protein FeoA